MGSIGPELGKVSTLHARILVWSNYCITKQVSLRSKTRTCFGRRWLCCFHLVDPTKRIRSTSTVPPQQESWLREVIDKEPPLDEFIATRNHSMKIGDKSSIGYDEALERRERLAKERRQAVSNVDGSF